jgi:hypothetical protein
VGLTSWLLPQKAAVATVRPRCARNLRHRRTVGLERLEERCLLASAIPVYSITTEPFTGAWGKWAGSYAQTAQDPTLPTLKLQAMERTLAVGFLPSSDPGDVFKINLSKSEFVTIDLGSFTASTSPFTLQLANSAGTVVASNSGVATDPDSGAPNNNNPAISYTTPTAGTYYIGLFNADPANVPLNRLYTLYVRPVGLDSAAALANPSMLQFQGGGMYAFLKGGNLNIVGPTGYGFQLTGNWTQITTDLGNGQTKLTFVASAGVSALVSPNAQSLAFGASSLPIPLPPLTSIIITTQPNGWGNGFGEIDQVGMTTGLAFLQPVFDYFQKVDGIAINPPDNAYSLNVRAGVQIGLALGQTIHQNIDTNAPLNPAVPYLYFLIAGGFSGSFGDAQLAIGNANRSVIVDPYDPYVYLGVTIPPGIPFLGSFAFGASVNGLIPFAAATKPSKLPPGYTFFGNLYGQLEVSIPVLGVVSVNVNANGMLSLNANHDGLLIKAIVSNSAWTIAALELGGPAAIAAFFAANPNLITDLGYAENGVVGIQLGKNFVPVSLTLNFSKSTTIATGSTKPALYFRGTVNSNPFAQPGSTLNTFMSFLQPNQSFDIDGALTTQQIFLGFTANYTYFGFSSTATVTATGIFNDPAASVFTVSGNMSFLGGVNVGLSGKIYGTGNFKLTGNADVTIAGFKMVQAQVVVVNQSITLDGSVNLGFATANLSGSSTTGSFTLMGNIQTDFGISGMPAAKATFTLSNTGLGASTQVDYLGQKAKFSGMIGTDLTFSFSTDVTARFQFTVLGYAVGPTAKAHVTLARAGGSTSLTGDFDLAFHVPHFSFNVDVTNCSLAFAGLGIPSYSGTGSAYVIGPLGTSPTVTVSVSNNALVIDLPVIPTFRIPLPF